MATHRSPRQPDLFETVKLSEAAGHASLLEEPLPVDFIERIRQELTGTLAKARAAGRMPWNLTAATLAELRFKSITGWLPDAEAEVLRESFAREMARLWAITELEAEEAP